MIRGIIFDSDETLIRYSKVGTLCIQQAARHLGLHIPKKDKINSMYGRSFRFIVQRFWGDKYYKKVLKEYKSLVLRYKLKEIPGAKKTVLELSKRFRLAVVSAKLRDVMIKNFKDIGLNTRKFKIMLSSEDTWFHKPDPRVFSRAIKALKLNRKEILYVGDTLVDFMAGKRAGFTFVAVTSGYFKSKDFKRVGLRKQNILKSIKYLPSWIKAHGN